MQTTASDALFRIWNTAQFFVDFLEDRVSWFDFAPSNSYSALLVNETPTSTHEPPPTAQIAVIFFIPTPWFLDSSALTQCSCVVRTPSVQPERLAQWIENPRTALF